MKILLLLSTLLLISPQSVIPPDTGIVEGIVIRQGTTDPMPNARVMLVAGDSARFAKLLSNLSAALPLGMDQILTLNGHLGQPLAPTVLFADSSGHFSFKNVSPGEYLVGAELNGYWAPDSLGGGATTVSTQSITVMAQQTSKLVIPLIRAGTITGRVFDSKDQPLPNIAVAAYRIIYQWNGRPALSLVAVNPEFSNARTTNDQGEYRLFGLAAGEYYIGTTTQRGVNISDPQRQYAFTFYPGVVDARQAQLVSLKDAESITGVDIRVQTKPALTISGQVINRIPATSNLRPNQAPSFDLVPHDSEWLADISGTKFSVVNSVADPADQAAGKFEIRGVFPGDYDLIAKVGLDIRGQWFPARTRVEIADRNVENVNITALPGVDVKVRVIFSGNVQAAELEKVRVEMYPMEVDPYPFYTMLHPGEALIPRHVAGTPMPPPAPILDSTGAFPFSYVADAQYQIAVLGLPDDAYINDVLEGTASIYNDGLVVSGNSPDEIHVLVNRNGATVEGDVRDARQKSFPNANVVLVPSTTRENRALYKSVVADAQGHFVLRGIAPGVYKLFAWESLPPYAHLNANFILKYEASGLILRLDAGSRVVSPALQIIPAN